MDTVGIDQRIESMRAEKLDGRREADLVFFFVVVHLVAVLGAHHAGGDDRRGAIQAGVVAHFFEHRQNFYVLEETLRDLDRKSVV